MLITHDCISNNNPIIQSFLSITSTFTFNTAHFADGTSVRMFSLQ